MRNTEAYLKEFLIKEIWHQPLVPNLLFYLLKNQLYPSYNKHMEKKVTGRLHF